MGGIFPVLVKSAYARFAFNHPEYKKDIPVFEICLEFWIKKISNGSVLYLNVETKRTQKAISYFSD